MNLTSVQNVPILSGPAASLSHEAGFAPRRAGGAAPDHRDTARTSSRTRRMTSSNSSSRV